MADHLVVTAVNGETGASESGTFEIEQVSEGLVNGLTGHVVLRDVKTGERFRLIQEPLS